LKAIFARLAAYPAPIRLLAFLAIVVLIWLPFALPIALLIRDPNPLTISAMGLLFIVFLLLIPVWGRRVHREQRIFQTYGLILTKQMGQELLLGLGLGAISLFALFGLQSWLGWVHWQASPEPIGRIILEGSLTGLGVGLAEEIVFRGWIFDELRRDYSPNQTLWANSLIFACLHFIKSISEIIRTFPQFPGLVLLGLALVWAKRSTHGRLGLAIGLHAGLVWSYYIVNVGKLVQYPGRVPLVLTGIDRNPLAGVMGLLFLTGLAALMRWLARRQLRSH
jgi:membrane protease YdiL (CAAX protease family)